MDRPNLSSAKNLAVIIKFSDMSKQLEEEVIKKAQEAVDLFNTDLQMAQYLRRHFEKEYSNSVWQCFVGRKFGCFVTYETKFYIYFYIGQMAFLLFKSG